MVFAKKKWGQNFLKDHQVIREIIEAVDLQNEDQVLEIGPGQGALTHYILQKTSHCQVVEIDPDCVELLHKKYPELTVIQSDILKAPWPQDSTLRIIGNLPYYLSSDIIILLCQHMTSVVDAHIMLQKEVAARLCAQPGDSDFSRLSILVQCHYHVEHILDVAPECFYPKPSVWSSVIRLKKRDDYFLPSKTFLEIVKKAFEKRRKTIRNSLSDFFSKEDFCAMNISDKQRAQEISLKDYQIMCDYYQNTCLKHKKI